MILQPLAFAINQYLHMDPDTIARLAKLDGCVIELKITDWHVHFFILPTQDGLTLLSHYDGKITTTLRGKLFDLIHISRAKGDTASLFKHAIEIEGDTKTGEAIQKILAKIDIDWEEQLSKITGDVMAHRVGKSARAATRFGKKTLKTLGDHIKSFLQRESNQLPSRAEVDLFIEEVTRLQQEVERLAARIKHFEQTQR